MRRFIVSLKWGEKQISNQVIDAPNRQKAKGQYIKDNLLSFTDCYPKNVFFKLLRIRKA